MKIIIVALLFVFVSGCVTTTKINTADPDEIVITGASDELIEYEGNGVKFKSDRRGRPGLVESAVNLGVMKAVGEVTE